MPSEAISKARLALIQMAMGDDRVANLDKAEAMVRDAAASGAHVVLLPELFETPYFPKDPGRDARLLARPFAGNTSVARLSAVAAELGVVLPVSFFEADGEKCYNSLVMIDADGRVMGLYRKSHIPEGPGYNEKDYFVPGDTGFKVWDTRYGCIGVGVCWDQWFPEAARAMALLGAEVLLCPTAIGSEPDDPELDTSGHWRRVMQGHAGANLCYLGAANRVGREQGETCAIGFYGTSFIAGPFGEVQAEARGGEEGVIMAELDLSRVRKLRQEWSLFRDRRPELYAELTRG
jgi:N-carbamoylputrescine amidase